jgi:hypothetical protein
MFVFWRVRKKNHSATARKPGLPALNFHPQLETLEERALPSISFLFNFSHDNSGFFNDPTHLQALQTAANVLGSHLGDSLEAIAPGGGNSWSATFADPATGNTASLSDLAVPADSLIIFAGARTLGAGSGDGTLGIGGPGGFNAQGTQSFIDTVSARGQAGALSATPTDFGPWGGSVVFDPNANWYFGLNPRGIGAGQEDFISVAEHELSHVLGFGTSPSWENRVSGNVFTGANAVREFGGPVPTDAPAPNAGHWADNTTDQGERCTMDPELPEGQTARLTPLDFAGLADLGWQMAGFSSTLVNQPPVATNVTLPDVAENAAAFTVSASTLLANDTPGLPSASGKTIALTAVGNPVGGTVALDGNGNAVFAPASGFTGQASFTYTITDNGTTNGQPDPRSASATATFNVLALSQTPTPSPPSAPQPASPSNAAPTVVVPHTLVAHRNIPLSFKGKSAISIRAHGTTASSLRVTLTALHGKLHIGAVRGLHVSGNNTAKLTLTGSLATLDRALAGLEFLPTKNFVGTAKIALALDPGSGEKLVTAAIAITLRR